MGESRRVVVREHKVYTDSVVIDVISEMLHGHLLVLLVLLWLMVLLWLAENRLAVQHGIHVVHWRCCPSTWAGKGAN